MPRIISKGGDFISFGFPTQSTQIWDELQHFGFLLKLLKCEEFQECELYCLARWLSICKPNYIALQMGVFPTQATQFSTIK